MIGEKLYRYYDAMSEDGYSVEIEIQEFLIIKETPCGYRYVSVHDSGMPDWWLKKESRWVSNSGRRRKCYPTRSEAWNSYKIRKSKQMLHAKAALDRVKTITSKIDRMDAPEESVKCGLFIFD